MNIQDKSSRLPAILIYRDLSLLFVIRQIKNTITTYSTYANGESDLDLLLSYSRYLKGVDIKPVYPLFRVNEARCSPLSI